MGSDCYVEQPHSVLRLCIMSKLLRDEKEVKLNDLVHACRKAAEHYRIAADMLEQGAAADMFVRMAESRSKLCREIEALVRSCGYLPDTLDPDRQTVENLAERARAFFSGDDRATMLNHALGLESDLISCARAALELAWPQDQYERVRGFQEEFERAKRTIEALIASDSDSERS
jgi:hypothetical protein